MHDMPRRKLSPPGEENNAKKPRPNVVFSKKPSDMSGFNLNKCRSWFHEYTASLNDDVIGPEGMEKFCEDIGVDPENVVMLSLAWKLNADQMGFFTLDEWIRGMTELQCDCVEKLQDKLDYLHCILNDPVTFKSIYRYAYDFAREKSQRSMDVATAKAMLALLLEKHWPLCQQFHDFVEQSKYKVINRDQWCNMYEFSRQVCPDLSNYDEDGAWPVLLDEFVEWYRRNNPPTPVQPTANNATGSSSAATIAKSDSSTTLLLNKNL